jgi:hypothetical protein
MPETPLHLQKLWVKGGWAEHERVLESPINGLPAENGNDERLQLRRLPGGRILAMTMISLVFGGAQFRLQAWCIPQVPILRGVPDGRYPNGATFSIQRLSLLLSHRENYTIYPTLRVFQICVTDNYLSVYSVVCLSYSSLLIRTQASCISQARGSIEQIIDRSPPPCQNIMQVRLLVSLGLGTSCMWSGAFPKPTPPAMRCITPSFNEDDSSGTYEADVCLLDNDCKLENGCFRYGKSLRTDVEHILMKGVLLGWQELHQPPHSQAPIRHSSLTLTSVGKGLKQTSVAPVDSWLPYQNLERSIDYTECS